MTPATDTLTSIPSPLSSPTETTFNTLIYNCKLLDSHDLASFFPSHAEVVLPEPQVTHVDHPIFSTGNAPGTETSCVYYTFHLPGSKEEVVLQVTYWLDLPASTAPAETWSQEWAQAKAQAEQIIPALGDEAFFYNGRMTFKTNDLYVTVEATETNLDPNTPAGVDKQLAIEKQIALDILGRLG